MEGRMAPREVSLERSIPLLEEGGGRVWLWVAFSALLHGLIIWSFFVVPYVPRRKAPSYPVYTVELVGGEKIGGEALSPVATPAPPTRQETKKLKVEPPPPAQVKREIRKEVKKEKKAAEKALPPREEVALEKSKKETKKEPQAEQALPTQVREKLIEAALQRVKERAQSEQKKPAEAAGSGPREGEGAAAAGSGGRGGGIVKGVEFIRYYNLMRYRIKERWTWVGKRSDLEVTVRFGIREDGDIVGLRIIQASGDSSYDDSVVRAVSKASPLPSPPEGYRSDFMDVELTFRPKDLGG